MGTFHFRTSDFVVGGAVILTPMLIGLWFAWRDKNKATREEYLLGGRKMALLPVTMSVFITFQSAIAQIGVPSEMYMYGAMYLIIVVGMCLSYLVGACTLVPLIYPLRLTSLYAYLELRYGCKSVRMLATVVGMLTTVLYMAVALLSPALALQACADIPLWMSIVLMGAIGTIYTAIGGIKSVIWTDAFQTVVVFVGLFTMIYKGVDEVGGVDEVWDIAERGHRTNLKVVSPDPRIRHSYWGCIIGGLFMWLVNGFNQSTAQRISSMPSLSKARLVYLLNIPILCVYWSLLSVVGIVIYSYFSKHQCDPYDAGVISNRNQLAPYFVLEALEDIHGVAGLYVSTLCCGALSTLSSGINALAANSVEDIIGGWLVNIKEGTITLITKAFVIIWGALIVGLAFCARNISGPVTQMSGTIFGACGSPILGIFLMGGAIPWVNKYGALAGAFCSLVFNIWLGVCNKLYGVMAEPLEPVPTDGCPGNVSFVETNLMSSSVVVNKTFQINFTLDSTDLHTNNSYSFFLYDISYEWHSVTGCIVCLVCGLLVSKLTLSCSDGKPISDPMLIFPFMRKYWTLDEPSCKENILPCIPIETWGFGEDIVDESNTSSEQEEKVKLTSSGTTREC